jgi:hypothetical protein
MEERSMRTRNILIAMVAAVALLGAACTSSAEETTTTTTIPAEIPDLEFGKGEVPFTVPAGFPIPDTAVIGTTMIDGVNGRTEMIVSFPSPMADVVSFYETNLPATGFEITDSQGIQTRWEIDHVKDGSDGIIKLAFTSDSISTATFIFIHS